MSVDSKELLKKSLQAAKWNYLGTALRVFLQVFVQIVLARILGPELLGVFAFVFILIGVGTVVVDMGMGACVVQRKKISADEIGFASSINLFFGIAFAVLTYLSADYVADFLGEPKLVDVLKGVSPLFVFVGLSVVPQAILRRSMDFKKIQLYQVLSYVFGFVFVGIGSAYYGFGVFSIVFAWLAQSVSLCLFLYMNTKLGFNVSFNNAKSMLGLGVRVVAVNVANWAIENIDNFMVGKLFGATSLGLYSVSYNLVRTPANHLVVGLQGVLFPASARAEGDKEILARAYLVAIAAVSLAVFPVFMAIASVAPIVVSAMFGKQWSDAADVLLPLALAMIPHALMAISGPVLWGFGKVGDELKVQTAVALLLAAALWGASYYTMTVAAWAVFLIYMFRCAILSWVISLRLKISVKNILRSVLGGFLIGTSVAFSLWCVDSFLVGCDPIFRLVFDIIFGFICFIFFLYLFPSHTIYDDLRLILATLLQNNKFCEKSNLFRLFIKRLKPSRR